VCNEQLTRHLVETVEVVDFKNGRTIGDPTWVHLCGMTNVGLLGTSKAGMSFWLGGRSDMSVAHRAPGLSSSSMVPISAPYITAVAGTVRYKTLALSISRATS
jgi:hypothetical protein